MFLTTRRSSSIYLELYYLCDYLIIRYSDVAAHSDESDDTVGGLIPLDTLLPVTPRPGSPPPIPVPRRSVRLKQPPAWHTSGEFSMSVNDKLYELKSLLTFDGVDKSIITTAVVSLLVGSP